MHLNILAPTKPITSKIPENHTYLKQQWQRKSRIDVRTNMANNEEKVTSNHSGTEIEKKIHQENNYIFVFRFS